MSRRSAQIVENYNLWSDSYDLEKNFLIDLERISISPRSRAIELYLKDYESVLDIGCGTGRHSQALSERFKRYLGIDVSVGMLSRAKEKNPKIAKSFLAKSFFDVTDHESFDFLHSSLSLMHFEDLDHFFNRAFELLKPGGVIYIVDADPQLLNLGSSPNFDRGDFHYEVPFLIHQAYEIRSAIEKSRLAFREDSATYFLHSAILNETKYDRYLGLPCLRHIVAQKEVL